MLKMCLQKTSSEESHEYPGYIFSKSSDFKTVFHPHEIEKPAFSISSGLKNVIRVKFRFRDGLVWTVDLTVEMKLRFQISPRNLDAAEEAR